MKQARLLSFVLLLVLSLLALPCLAGGKPHLGFGTQVGVSGFFSPTLTFARISEVAQDSPAAKAGLKAGDELIEANGKAIKGAPAREMSASFKNVKPGEHLRLKVKRGDGTLVSIDIVAE